MKHNASYNFLSHKKGSKTTPCTSLANICFYSKTSKINQGKRIKIPIFFKGAIFKGIGKIPFENPKPLFENPKPLFENPKPLFENRNMPFELSHL